MKFAVKLDGFPNDPRPYIVRGNIYPQSIATYDTREAAQAMADKCPESYQARVVEWRQHVR